MHLQTCMHIHLAFKNVPYLIIFGRAGIQWPAQEQFGNNTTEWPHVDCLAKWQTQYDFGRSIVARLQVRIANGFADMRSAAKVNDFDAVLQKVFYNLSICQMVKFVRLFLALTDTVVVLDPPALYSPASNRHGSGRAASASAKRSEPRHRKNIHGW